MKVTFEIEIQSSDIERLDYYENYGDLMSPEAGCKKCIFQPMCNDFAEKLFSVLPDGTIDCKFPCWNSQRERKAIQNRGVFVIKKEGLR